MEIISSYQISQLLQQCRSTSTPLATSISSTLLPAAANSLPHIPRDQTHELPFVPRDIPDKDVRARKTSETRTGKLIHTIQQVDIANEILIVLHSSGSTQSYPKLIKWNYQYIQQIIDKHRLLGHSQDDVLFCMGPSYHAFGMFTTISSLSSGSCVVFPLFETYPPTNQAIINSSKQSKSNVLLTLPYILEQLVSDHDSYILQFLRSMKRVVYGGAQLHDEVGNYCWKNGVKLLNTYGSTEGV